MLRHILANLGFLLQIAGVLCILPVLVGLFLGETQNLASLFLTCIFFLAFGFLMNVLAERKDVNFKESCALVLLAFLILPLIGAIPYMYDDPFASTNIENRVTNAYFESVSGFTTTGFTFIPDSDTLPRSVLLYRSMTELMGGVGIVFLLLAFFHSKKSLYSLGNALGIESSGTNVKRIFYSVFIVYGVYLLIFIGIFYALGFQDLIKTSCFAIDTLTGGYQPAPGQFQQYLALPTRICIMLLMLIGSVNFSFHYNLFSLKLRRVFSKETLLFALVIIVGTGLVYATVKPGLSASAFHVISMSSSTGYDYINVPMFDDTARSIFIVLMLLGGCGFSMAGGIRMFRIIGLFKSFRQTVKDTLVRESVIGRENSGSWSDHSEFLSISTSILLFLITLFVFATAFSALGLSLTDSLFEVGSALTTNGISMGATTVSMPLVYKWLMVTAMIVGRVEILSILVAFSTYKRVEQKLRGPASTTDKKEMK